MAQDREHGEVPYGPHLCSPLPDHAGNFRLHVRWDPDPIPDDIRPESTWDTDPDAVVCTTNPEPLGPIEEILPRSHETRANGASAYDEAHEEALKLHPMFKNYDPEVIQEHSEWFSGPWRDAWGLP
ncbi:hypothetical protein GCM10009555_051080 [Acrocarpospora macrocephala]|uniref:Uncharacterized protein n=1 Tax=Acrocarpospora macrocephala TaxID=150177 RepID=A0A5M3X413_9ACTN|nr:hypothetical protein Amac_079880 [Acrocarpospora macrocephala]